MGIRKSFLICGGDMRQISLAEELARSEFKVYTYGFGNAKIKGTHSSHNLDNLLKNVDFVVLPLPALVNNEFVNMPLSPEELSITTLLKKMNKNHIILGGKITPKMKQLGDMYSIYMADYFAREELIILNAIPTVEGAIQIAMEETDITIHGSRCLVLGYGRIGKLLSKSLMALGAKTSAAARKLEDLAWIRANGIDALRICDLAGRIGEFDMIFNTVPARILDEHILAGVKKGALIIDVASEPGGVDFEAAKTLGVKVNWALSLPGKVAPLTAAVIIKDTIINLIGELGV